MLIRTTFPVFALAILASGSTIKTVAAATAGASISVSATVQASCRASATPTAIGTGAAATEAGSPVAVSCSNAVPYNITLIAKVARSADMAILPRSDSALSLLPNVPWAFSSRADNPTIVVVTY